uniref:hypothetical protein n=1 Tax=Fulvivirga sp. TaxID=1931237 RepID=UPI00404A9350
MLKNISNSFKLFIILSATSLQLVAQDHVECATQITQEQINQMLEIEKNYASQASQRTSNEPSPRPVFALSINIVRNTNGTGGITEAAVRNELAIVNSYYLKSGIEFYIKTLKYINNSEFFNFSENEEG